MSEESIVEDWLRSLHLGRYTQSFLDNGYDDLEICKQIGDPDLDAIGVSNPGHRRQILLAVRVLLEQGGTAVYFTLEEYRRVAEAGYRFEAEDFRDRRSGHFDEYEEGKAQLLRFPKLQLKILVRDKLDRDGIRLSAPPYSNPDGCSSSRGHLETLAVRYAQELRTHQQDVLERLQELRRRCKSVAPPTDLADTQPASRSSEGEYRPAEAPPSQSLDQSTTDQTSECTTLVVPHRFLSPRSRYFYEPCPFPSGEFRENGGEDSLGESHHGKYKRSSGGGLGKLFRTLQGNKKASSPKHKAPKAGHHSFTLRLHDRCKSSSQTTVHISEPLLGDEDRYQLMRMLRDGSMTVEEAVHRIGSKQIERHKDNRLHGNYVLSSEVAGDGDRNRKGLHKPTSVFYLDSGCFSSGCGTLALGPSVGPDCPAGPESVVPAPAGDRTLPGRGRTTGPRRAFTQEEFTSAILARTQVTLGEKLPSVEGSSVEVSAEACRGQCGNIMCSLGSSSDLSPPPTDGAREPCAARPLRREEEEEEGSAGLRQAESVSAEGMECNQQQTQAGRSPCSPPPIQERNDLLGKLRNSLTNRNSYSTSEEGHSSACEDTEDMAQREASSEEVCPQVMVGDGEHPRGRSSSSSFAGKVRDLHRDVKRRISKLRGGTPRATSDGEVGSREGELPGCVLQAGSSLESLPSGCSEGSRTSLQGQTPTSSNRSSSSAGEEEVSAGVGYLLEGPVLGRARALVDVNPSPYDRDALGFKKGDMIDIIAKNKTGTWVGVLHGKVGHFKFINVQEIQEGNRGHRSRIPRASQQPLSRPQSLEQLLEQNGLQEYVNVLMLHGYEDLDAFREISREDLSTLGISDPAVQRLLLRAADMLHTDEQDGTDDCLAEGWVETDPLGTSPYSMNIQATSGESTFMQPDEAPINDLDVMDGCSNTGTSNGIGGSNRTMADTRGHSDQSGEIFLPNISGAEESTVSLLRTTAQILKQSGEGCSVSYPLWREDLRPPHENGCRGGAKAPPPPVPMRTTPPRPSKLANGVNGGGLYFAVAGMTEPVGEGARSATLPRQKSSQDEDSAAHKSDRKLYKKLTHRKGSIQQQQQQAGNKSKFPRPPSLSLLTAICRKLEDEDIDLGQEPYTDKTGFCGIPPALVQRYAEELQRDVYDVAEAMDQARINSLQIRGRRGVPNDFLADSCYGPVVEANYRGLHEWLVSLGLPMYEQELAAAGFQHLARVASLRDADLCAAGVHNARHVRLLTTAIGALNIHFGRLLCP